MATQPTQDSVPSESPRDLKFNAGKIDEFVTSMGLTYTDRFGQQHNTIEGINYIAQQAMDAYGYVILTGKTFTTGATINNPNEVLLNTADGEYYKWTGSFASGGKVVPANSTPSGSGGIGPGAWIGVGDASLRAALSSTEDGNGDELIGMKQPLPGTFPRTVHDKFTEAISIRDFGAIGDGALHPLSERYSTLAEAQVVYPFVTSLEQSIDYAAVQAAINEAISNKKSLKVTSGNFYSSDPLIIKVENHYSKNGLCMLGDGRAISLFTFPLGSDGFKIIPVTSGEYTYNVTLSDFDIIQDGHDDSSVGTAGIGIHATNGCSHMLWHNLRITGFKQGVKFDDAVFLCSFTSMNISICADGFIMGTMGTTVFMDNMFVYGSTGTAYRITAVYSSIGSLACDSCAGIPYDFYYFSGSVGSLGFESAGTNTAGPIVRFDQSHVQIGTVYGFNLTPVTSLSTFFDFGASDVDISKIYMDNSGASAILTAKFYTCFQSHIRFKDIDSDYTFSFTEPNIGSDISSSFVEFDGVKQSHGGVRPYIGSLGGTGQAIAQNGKDFTPPAFLFDCFGGYINSGSNGDKNLGFASGPRLGQWGIERRPDLHGVAAYVSTSNATDNNSATFAVVPAILFTSTRPQNPVVGTHWSDPVSHKIIYYAYGKWQDYMGNTIQ
ncbi:hypothetical protein QCN08_04000 [Enterobacter roggenkampii]|uniref:tail fiber/spike domain-containing protein n=1 Tax=Enterobacter roggenkampii TaxID=1812935 RepID=UPI002FD84B8D